MSIKSTIILNYANYLGKYGFLLFGNPSMWEMHLLGFISAKHTPYIKNIVFNYKEKGAMAGLIGNKGGLQLCFRLYDYLFNFISVHLVHGAKKLDKRNEMMSDLIKILKIYREEIDSDVLSDFSFILGDLNYRMNSTFDDLVPQMSNIHELKD